VESGKARPKQTIQANEKHKIGVVAFYTFSADGSTLASWGGVTEKSVRLWSSSNGKERLKLPAYDGKTLAVAFSPDGKLLASLGASGDGDGRRHVLYVYDAMSGKELYNKAFDFKAKEGQFKAAVALSPNGKTLAWARDRTIQLLDIENGKELTAQQDLAGTVYCLGFSPNGKTLASGGDDQCVQLWEIASAKLK
jgi:WD40 repeat protein